MEDKKQWIIKDLFHIYEKNPYVNLLGMIITNLEEGKAELSMPVSASKHTNLYNVAHGGALASLADTVMGIACATTGKRVVTLEMNMNFIKGVVPQSAIKAIGNVIHNGQSTMIVEGEIFDGNNKLVAKSRGTFFVTGKFEDINW